MLLLFAGCAESDSPSGEAYPSRPIKLVIPFAAGGGSDAFARTMKAAIDQHHLLPQPLVIINVEGAGATIGSRRVKNARPDGYTILMLHEALVMAKHTGSVNYGAEAFEPVAGTSENGIVVAVAEESQYQDLAQLMQAAAAAPGTITFGCNLGAPTHFVALLLERRHQQRFDQTATFRTVQSGGGAHRFSELRGGHVEVTAFSMEEYLRFRPSGVRALAVLAPKRHPAVPELPTALEQGYDVNANNVHFWWVPKGTPAERKAVLAEALEKALETDYVRQKLAEVHADPIFLTADQVAKRVAALDREIAALELRPSTDVPNFPALVLTAIALLAVAVLWQSRNCGGPVADSAAADVARPRWALAAGCMAATAAYVLAMNLGWVGFRAATVVFVLAVGGAMAGKNIKTLAVVLVVAICAGPGVYHLFTQVFVIDLP